MPVQPETNGHEMNFRMAELAEDQFAYDTEARLFYFIHLRIVFAETELPPAKMQNPTLTADFSGSLAYVFAARRALGRCASPEFDVRLSGGIGR